jgi:hypothetical protein
MNEFEKLMKREGMERLTERPKEVYIARFRLYGEEDVTLVEEFDTKEDRDIWYESFGKMLEEEEGGKIEFDNGPSELNQ